ncbi:MULTISPECIES: hypothetical protein [unclassified Sphingomonas]|uniref:hypothetical protein n=1 Tax=unclassified Sphingomonas TaxID=196159 RepID=UPI0012E16D32|nr:MULTISPECIES: hypothetical protein [unclassified Sphingomonas]
MFLFATILASFVVMPADRVEAWIVAEQGEPAYASVSWDRLPTEAEVKALLPQAKTGTGYAHLRCALIARNGQLTRCKTDHGDVNLKTSLDPDYERAGLLAVKYFRVDRELAKKWQGRSYSIVINVAFTNGTGVRVWGNCYPFCQAGLPNAPVPPNR